MSPCELATKKAHISTFLFKGNSGLTLVACWAHAMHGMSVLNFQQNALSQRKTKHGLVPCVASLYPPKRALGSLYCVTR